MLPVGKSHNVRNARRFTHKERCHGYADSMAEAAVRFVISNGEISTALVGIASIEQLGQALASAAKGPLPTEALDKLHSTWESFASH